MHNRDDAPSGTSVAASAGLQSPNFGHLAKAVPLLADLGARAERYVFEDPPTTLFKLRQFGEVLAQEVAATVGHFTSSSEPQTDLLRRLRSAGVIDFEVADLFHALRVAGNDAVHRNLGGQRDALHHLRLAAKLGHWFQCAFKDARFKGQAFVPPPDPAAADYALSVELAALRKTVAEQAARTGTLQSAAQSDAARAAAAAELACIAYEDLEVALNLASETEAKVAKLELDFKAQLVAVQAAAQSRPAVSPSAADAGRPAVSPSAADAGRPNVDALIQQAQAATRNLQLDESETRLLIDAQLRAAGWEADTVGLSYAAGTRPSAHQNIAIAEWPTPKGPADYILFVGLTPVAVVEAKRRHIDVAGSIEQSKRYSKAYDFTGEPPALNAPYGDYKIPFLFATNGRAFLRQLTTSSGIWFLDARRPTNLSRPLEGWYTPDGLSELLKLDVDQADTRLATAPSSYLPLHDYQRAAIAAVEAAIAAGQQDMLLAMATGTGKTRLALCLMYRLIKAGRFRRILFLVDRTALGDQAHAAFAEVKLENLQSFTEIYDVKGMGDLRPDPDTRLHIATVQGMVNRLASASDAAPPVDGYDCIIIDECHRGYALDQEMTDLQLAHRSEADYISSYRRVLDHFDATRIGLTATPALHTTQIFGPPIFEYTYRQAVADGRLIDHEPPIRIQTALNTGGIHWRSGEEVAEYNTASAQLQLFNTPDDIDIEVDGFNTKVITESFNRVVCAYLAREIDPSLPGKTMIFCATDHHADMVVAFLKQALADTYGQVEDDCVMKITGASDKPHDKLRRYKTERLPKFAVTVDLLTTGIDVPQITNIVFIRRIKSRILYDQMLGRATRRCDDIGKELFRIYDAVDLYAALLPYSAMKPVVTRPHLTFAQLTEELTSSADPAHVQAVRDELRAKLHMKKRRLTGEHLDAFMVLASMSPEALVTLLGTAPASDVIDFFKDHPDVAAYLDRFKTEGGRDILVSSHADALTGSERGYGSAKKPEDYLEGFRAYLAANKNAVTALLVVTTRPRDLTRKQLRELKLTLDQAGYPESALRTAVAQVSNQDIAASIIGFIRQQALGSALVPYDQRVDRALSRVLASRQWTSPQRRWLDIIGKQLKVEVIVDRDAFEQGQFKVDGGFDRFNKVFDGQLEAVLSTLHDEVWKDVG